VLDAGGLTCWGTRGDRSGGPLGDLCGGNLRGDLALRVAAGDGLFDAVDVKCDAASVALDDLRW
jgi:hypothetical protein